MITRHKRETGQGGGSPPVGPGRLGCLLFLGALLSLPASSPGSILASADPFAALAASTVTSTGASLLNGDLGLSPGTAFTGFPPGVVSGTVHAADSIALQAQVDALAAYSLIFHESMTQDLTGQDLGGLTLTPGVLRFSSSSQLTGVLTLDARGDFSARFDFQIGSTLTTAAGASLVLINGAQAANVYWQVGSSATLGVATDFAGTILADQSITVTTGATIRGRAIALHGAVTLDNNTLTVPQGVPEPATLLALLLCPVANLVTARRRRRLG